MGELDALETFWALGDLMGAQPAFDPVAASYVSETRLRVGKYRVRVDFAVEIDERRSRTEIAPPLTLSLNVGPLACGSLELERSARRHGVFQRLFREFEALGFHGRWIDGMDGLTGTFSQHVWVPQQAARAVTLSERPKPASCGRLKTGQS
jgi:hypothetical protein